MDRCPFTTLDGTISHSELQWTDWRDLCYLAHSIYLVSLGPEGNLIQWCTEQVEWLPTIHSLVSKDKTAVSVVMLNVSLWLVSHENGTQSNRKNSISNQCFRPHVRCFWLGWSVGKRCCLQAVTVSLNCDSTGELAWIPVSRELGPEHSGTTREIWYNLSWIMSLTWSCWRRCNLRIHHG